MKTTIVGRKRREVSPELIDQIAEALESVDAARVELNSIGTDAASLRARRAAHAELSRAFDHADALLRQATAIAKERSYRDWAQWRSRLSHLDLVRQIHLFAEQDDPSVLPLGSVRAIDTGMTAPDTGDLMHGQSKPPGAPALYGLEVDGG